MQTKYNIIKGLSIISVLGILLSCSPKEPVKIGFVAGLSGRRSQLGVSARNGVQLAVKNINERGGINGRKIKLIIKDDKNDPATGGKVINELIDEEAVAIIGPLLSKMADSALKAINGKDVLMISPTISSDAVKDRDDNFLRVMPVAGLEARTVVKAILEDGYRKAAVVYDLSNRAYTQPIYMIFKTLFEKQGNKITYAHALETGKEKKLGKIAKEIVNSHPDVLLIITSGIDAAFLCQQIRKVDSDIQFYGAYWVKSGNIIEEGGRSVEGLRVVAPYESEKQSEEYLTFQNQYKKMFHAVPGFVSVYAYEAVQVLFAGIEHSKSMSPDSIKASILKVGHFKGLEETFKINEFGDALRSNSLFAIQDGKFVRISK